MSYLRVIPRDLFNEAKLLKCIGRLCLMIHDGDGLGVTFSHNDEAFDIRQDESDGSLFIRNIHFFLDKKRIGFHTAYNSKRNYPLLFNLNDNFEFVFDDEGNYTAEYRAACADAFVDSILKKEKRL